LSADSEGLRIGELVEHSVDIQVLADELTGQIDLVAVGGMRLDEQVVNVGGGLVRVAGDEECEELLLLHLLQVASARLVAAGQDDAGQLSARRIGW